MNGTIKKTITIANSSQEELIPYGVLSFNGQTTHNFYRKRAEEAEDLFAMVPIAIGIDYTTTNTTTGAVGQYNGNISQIKWKTMGDANTSIYGFEYDDLNRLVNAKYNEESGPGDYNTLTIDNYSVSNITYDLNGNIQTLNRRGFITTNSFGDIDQMTYAYSANQLQSVHDAANDNKGFKETSQSGIEYQYDANGNMTRDGNKGIDIEYNHLNLPVKVSFDSGEEITWIYDAAGVKLYKVSTNADPTPVSVRKDYLGGIEYADNVVEAIYHSEGRAVPNGSDYTFEYTLKDHLGNSRVTFADLDKDGEVAQSEILQTNHYYPFGMTMELPSQLMGNPNNAYQYNGKELNSDFGLDWLDYGARWYDASIGRWSAVDPLSEKYYSISPYVYVANNPLKYIDPDGKRIRWKKWKEGESGATKKEYRKRKKTIRKRIRYLKRNSKTFKTMWKDMKKSQHVHTIILSNYNDNKVQAGNQDDPESLDKYLKAGNSSTIYLSADGNDYGINDVAALAHEIGHAWRINGGLDPEYDGSDDSFENKVYAYKHSQYAEYEALHIENIIRSEIGMDAREEYSNVGDFTINDVWTLESKLLDVSKNKMLDFSKLKKIKIKKNTTYDYSSNRQHYELLKKRTKPKTAFDVTRNTSSKDFPK